MSQVIIYKEDDGLISVVFPSSEAVAAYGVHAVALKDVPAGKPFRILNVSELPFDQPQESWVVDDSELSDGFGADYNSFPENLK